MAQPGLKRMKVAQILGLYAAVLEELCQREVLRSANNPAADYAAHLVCHAPSLRPAQEPTKGYDATDRKRKRYEIKDRRSTTRSRPTRFSAVRKLPDNHFDYLAAVLFAEDFHIQRAVVLPRIAVVSKAFFQKHVNGWILPLNDKLWQTEGARDITDLLRRLQFQHGA